MMRPYRRRRILVDNLQYRLLALNLIYFFTILLIFAGALFVPLIIQLESRTLSFAAKQEVASQFLFLDARVWPAILIVFVLLAIHSVFASHRIAGPLYRFRRVFEAVAEGNLTARAIIRKNDYLVTDADTINAMIATLNTRITRIEQQHGKVRALFAELKRAAKSGSMEEMQQTIEMLGTQMEQLKVYLDQFKIAGNETSVEDKAARNPVQPSPPAASARIARS
ncbi:MAG: methyl-accepting chemotaxis protein [Acidobacteria bacterium]|nr:methyl-accepting chemotaxis protein [Acidobacteriota bacterium]